MKRLNPKTGKPFTKGDIREDGYIFERFNTKLKTNGYFAEQWYSPKSLENKKACGRKCSKRYSAIARLTVNGRAKKLYRSAKSRGPISISVNWIEEKLKIGICEISGLKFDLSPSDNFSKNPYSPSLDRIDPNNPEYSIENTRLVLTCVNQALNQYGLEHFLKVAQAVIDYQKDK